MYQYDLKYCLFYSIIPSGEVLVLELAHFTKVTREQKGQFNLKSTICSIKRGEERREEVGSKELMQLLVANSSSTMQSPWQKSNSRKNHHKFWNQKSFRRWKLALSTTQVDKSSFFFFVLSKRLKIFFFSFYYLIIIL